MTLPPYSAWRPIPPGSITELVAPFENWCLCGGMSVDWLAGRPTRPHGDTDIGVFRSEVEACLTAVGYLGAD
ncbi:MAG: hypothetical protein CMD83_05285 [Gammaproteobacteria bacterium]|nr:hypothetical protein [Gammaproteobacteria bacterium]